MMLGGNILRRCPAVAMSGQNAQLPLKGESNPTLDVSATRKAQRNGTSQVIRSPGVARTAMTELLYCPRDSSPRL